MSCDIGIIPPLLGAFAIAIDPPENAKLALDYVAKIPELAVAVPNLMIGPFFVSIGLPPLLLTWDADLGIVMPELPAININFEVIFDLILGLAAIPMLMIEAAMPDADIDLDIPTLILEGIALTGLSVDAGIKLASCVAEVMGVELEAST